MEYFIKFLHKIAITPFFDDHGIKMHQKGYIFREVKFFIAQTLIRLVEDYLVSFRPSCGAPDIPVEL